MSDPTQAEPRFEVMVVFFLILLLQVLSYFLRRQEELGEMRIESASGSTIILSIGIAWLMAKALVFVITGAALTQFLESEFGLINILVLIISTVFALYPLALVYDIVRFGLMYIKLKVPKES